MAFSNAGFTVAPRGQTITINTVQENGATAVIYSDQALTSQVTLPAVITADTTYYADLKGRTAASFALGVYFANSPTTLTSLTVPLTQNQTTVLQPAPALHLLDAAVSGPSSGTATLSAGQVTVSDTGVTADTIVRAWHKNQAGTTGALFISAKSVGTSFTIKSTSSTDTSVVSYNVISY